MTDFFDRLNKFMKTKGLNDNKLTVETGISNGLIGKARKRGSLSQENISKILLTYRTLDANWLLTGEGNMIKNSGESPATFNVSTETEKIYRDLLKEKDRTIQELNREIGSLQEKINHLKKESTYTDNHNIDKL